MKKVLSPAQHRELAELNAMPDEEIDTSDIPELPEKNWRYLTSTDCE